MPVSFECTKMVDSPGNQTALSRKSPQHLDFEWAAKLTRIDRCLWRNWSNAFHLHMKTAAFEKKGERNRLETTCKRYERVHFNAVTIACVFLVSTQRKQIANTCNEQEETPALSTVQLWTSGGVYVQWNWTMRSLFVYIKCIVKPKYSTTIQF